MNQNWSNGYVADLTYSHGYYHELAPAFIRFFLLLNGLANASRGGDYHYCELGYGQGVSANLHAAANPRGRFWGTDFQPDHALFAQGMARQAGVQAHWMARSFEDMVDADLPEFDFVTLHGVWSWIHAPARHAIVEFLRRKLKVGGVVYMSYNIMPGWSAEKPLRDLLWLHSELDGARGDATTRRIQRALEFGQRLRSGRAAYFEQNPKAGQMLDDMVRDDIHVVAHEYFNRSWHIVYFAELAETLEAAGLGFACSLHKSDLVGEVLQRRQACGLPLKDGNVALRETTNDFILNRRFRRDVFVRGADRLARSEREAMLRQVGLVLLRPASTISTTVQTPYGTVSLDPGITGKMLQVLDGASGLVTLDRLIVEGGLADSPVERVFETAAALVAQNQAFPVFPDDTQRAGDSRARAMNRAIAERARGDDNLRYLASPVTGHAIDTQHTDRLFLLAWERGARTPAQLCAAALPWQQAFSGGDADSARGDLEGRAAQFFEHVLPLWRRLGLVDTRDKPGKKGTA